MLYRKLSKGEEKADLRKIEKAGVIRYIEEFKAKGVVRHIGLSSHTSELVGKVLAGSYAVGTWKNVWNCTAAVKRKEWAFR